MNNKVEHSINTFDEDGNPCHISKPIFKFDICTCGWCNAIHRVHVKNKEGIHIGNCTQCGNNLVHVMIDTETALRSKPSTTFYDMRKIDFIYKDK